MNISFHAALQKSGEVAGDPGFEASDKLFNRYKIHFLFGLFFGVREQLYFLDYWSSVLQSDTELMFLN